jgi:NADH:ubiquinone oxidoreductase subunit D
MIKYRYILVLLLIPFCLVAAKADTAQRDPWVDYFLDQISGIRVEISRLESDGVVEELRREQALEEKVNQLTKNVEELRALLNEQQILIESIKSNQNP